MGFLRRFFLHSPKRYVSGLLLATALILLALYFRGYDRIFYYYDAFTLSGAAVFLIGLLQLVAYFGAFDTFGYGFSSFSGNRKYDSLYEYSSRKWEKRSRGELVFMPYIVVGVLVVLVGFVIRLLSDF